MKKLTVLTQYFYPDVATTGQLLTELCVSLAAHGYDVDVVTAYPTYQRTHAPAAEEYRGVRIRRIPSTRLDKNSMLGKVLNSLTFFLSAVAVLMFRRRRAPMMIVSNPPFLPLAGTIAGFFRSVPYVFLVHDVYPDIAVRLGYIRSGGVVEWAYNLFNSIMLRRAGTVIVLSAAMKRIIEGKLGPHKTDGTTVRIIHNWADGEFIRPLERSTNGFLAEHGLQGTFVVLYSGNMGLFHDLEMLIDVAQRSEQGMVFLFIGDGGKRKVLEDLVHQRGVTNVRFLPYQPVHRLPESLTSASISVVSLEENIEGMAMPSKLYTLLAAGNPIVAICDEHSDVRTIIDDAECGFTVRHHQAELMTERLRELMNDPARVRQMGRNARTYFEGHFTLTHAVAEYRSVLENIDRRES